MYPSHATDVIIGVVVGVVAIALLMAYSGHHPRDLKNVIYSEDIQVILVIGFGIGCLAYTIARKKRGF